MNRAHPPELESCRLCPRLVDHREAVAARSIMRRRKYQTEPYWGRPLPGFGDLQARIVLVGLAPGAHGSNRTGRMFTGDGSGQFLYKALYRVGLASQAESTRPGDGMELKDVWITAACRCVPPGNKPLRSELANCRRWLSHDFSLLPNVRVVVAMGAIAHDAYLELLRSYGRTLTKNAYRFRHGAIHRIPDTYPLLDTYHVSFQNTNTGRLTTEMFDAILEVAKAVAAGEHLRV